MARRGPPSSTKAKSEGEGTLATPLRPKTGLTLLVPDSSLDLAAVVLALRGRGLRPVVAPLTENVFQIVANWRPRATIVQAGVPEWPELLRFLSQREIPTVVIGDPQQLRRAEELGAVSIGMPLGRLAPWVGIVLAFHRGRASWHTVTISAFDTPNMCGLTIPGVRGPQDGRSLVRPSEEETRCRAPPLSGNSAVGKGEVPRVGAQQSPVAGSWVSSRPRTTTRSSRCL